MSKEEVGYARIDRLYHVMVELLNLPKTIDVMRKMPAYVKDGEVYDFNDRSFGSTDKPDGNIFKDVERVKTVKAVTAALKRDYTKALEAWLGAEVSEAEPEEVEAEVMDEPEEIEADAVDLIKMVKALLADDKIKKAKKLVKENKDHPKAKKAKKLIKAIEEE